MQVNRHAFLGTITLVNNGSLPARGKGASSALKYLAGYEGRRGRSCIAGSQDGIEYTNLGSSTDDRVGSDCFEWSNSVLARAGDTYIQVNPRHAVSSSSSPSSLPLLASSEPLTPLTPFSSSPPPTCSHSLTTSGRGSSSSTAEVTGVEPVTARACYSLDPPLSLPSPLTLPSPCLVPSPSPLLALSPHPPLSLPCPLTLHSPYPPPC